MQSSRLLIGLLLLATLLVDLMALSIVNVIRWPYLDWPNPVLAVLFSLCFSQVSLAGLWTGLGTTVVPWRIAGTVSLITLWSVALATAAEGALSGYGKTDWTILLLAQLFLILPPLLIVRSKGGRLVNLVRPDVPAPRRRLQFTLAYLFAWLTATAITLGMLQYTVNYEVVLGGQFDWLPIIVLGLCNAAVALAAFWTVLATRWPRLRAASMCLTTGAVIYVFFRIVPFPEYFAAFVILWLLETVLLLVWLSVLRVAGFRLAWKNAKGQPAETEPWPRLPN